MGDSQTKMVQSYSPNKAVVPSIPSSAQGHDPLLGKWLANGHLIPRSSRAEAGQAQGTALGCICFICTLTAPWAHRLLAGGRRKGKRQEIQDTGSHGMRPETTELGSVTYSMCQANCFTFLCLHLPSGKMDFIVILASLGYSED